MINPYDLMVGNWIQHPKGYYVEVRSPLPGYVQVKDYSDGRLSTYTEESDFFNPIPLTPELMERIGWVKHADNGYLKTYRTPNNYFVAFPQRDDAYRKIADPISGLGDCEVVVHYLHELQNLYRWETGKQLEVKL